MWKFWTLHGSEKMSWKQLLNDSESLFSVYLDIFLQVKNQVWFLSRWNGFQKEKLERLKNILDKKLLLCRGEINYYWFSRIRTPSSLALARNVEKK